MNDSKSAKIRFCVFVALLLSLSVPQHAMPQAYAELEGDTITLGNERIERSYTIHASGLRSEYILDKDVQNRYAQTEARAAFPWEEQFQARSTGWEKKRVEATSSEDAHLLLEGVFAFDGFQIRHAFRLYDDAPAIQRSCWISIDAGADAATVAKLNAFPWKLDQVDLPGRHWQVNGVEFFDRTDETNNLTSEESRIAFTKPETLRGNLFWASPVDADAGLFWLKEAPTSESQLNYPGFDFEFDARGVAVVGGGIDATALHPDTWYRAYSVVTGAYAQGYDGLRIALRQYQKKRRLYLPERDAMLMMNTWGDRNRDASINDPFLRAEVDAATRLGLTHFQIDDGWQAGLSQNSAAKAGEKWDSWEREDWLPHPVRLPNGLQPIAQYAESKGIELGLWFNPTRSNEYMHWVRDADIVLDLYRTYGIKYFKIDGVELPTKVAEHRFRRFCQRIHQQSKGEIVLHLDATAGQRSGYHYLNKYGVIFLENRYTDWANYYPHWTLRNLWMLAHYVPPERLQMEFLNIWRNADKYPADDALAPAKIPFDYVFASVMMAQPLAWFEATGLPEEAFEISDLVDSYKSLMPELHQGVILPIGNEPDGRQWTGFQSISSEASGFLLILREQSPESRQTLDCVLPEGRQIELEPLLPAGASSRQSVGPEGGLTFELDSPFSYQLFRYRIGDEPSD